MEEDQFAYILDQLDAVGCGAGDVTPGHGCGIVESVAGEQHFVTLAMEFLNECVFVGWTAPGEFRASGNCRGAFRGIAGREDDLDSCTLLEGSDCRTRSSGTCFSSRWMVAASRPSTFTCQ